MNLRKKVLTKMKPKKLNGKNLNGEMFVSLCNSYVAAINNGAIPNIENAWNYMCKDECIKAVNAAFETYERSLKENLISKIPTTSEEIKSINKLSKESAMEVYKKKALGENNEEFENELLRKMKIRIN